MGTGNALRATETFTLIQLEEEKQKLKKKELLKSMLTDSEFSIKGQCAINLMMTKLDIINTFLLMKYKRNFIQMKTWRLKSYDSVCKKMQKKGLDLNFDLALEKINDLIGVRAVCAYVDDIYKAQIMSSHIGEIFEARVSGVANFGIFVELENTSEGLINLNFCQKMIIIMIASNLLY